MIINEDQLPHASRLSLTLLRRSAAGPVWPVVVRLSGEFHDMPRLRLTIGQAARLGACDGATAAEALRALVAAGLLIDQRDGTFGLAEASLSHA